MMGLKKILLACVVYYAVLGEAMSRFEFTEKDLASEESLWDLYERWKAYHSISLGASEKQQRFNVFQANVMHINEVNNKDKPYKLKLNRFADMTAHEFSSVYFSNIKHHRMIRGPRAATGFMHENATNLPASVDWRKQGAVTGIKDQGNCGSCWAFSTVVGVEGINKIKNGKLVSLSEQELIDCDKKDQGCNGGLMEDAYNFIKDNGGLTTEQIYPHTASDGNCDAKKMNNPDKVKIDGHENVPANDENALMKAVANQPVSVAIDAGGSDMQFYSEGVFIGKCGTELNHGVAAVGYGTTSDGKQYWIVRNSWGTEWGEQGYIRMQRGIEAKEGLCGIAMEASYPIINTSHNPTLSPVKDEL